MGHGRPVFMGVIGKARELRWRAAGHYTRPLGEDWVAPFRGGTGLEIGGPSALFRSGGVLPIYAELVALDGVQVPEAHVLWHGELREGPYETGEPGLTGRLYLREGGDLGHLPSNGYDAVLSSHVLEHLANPIGALREWLRVLRPGGHLLTVLPHKEGCADRRRPTTTLEHMLEDERLGVGEDDMTHAEEVIALHDLRHDPAPGDRDGLRARVMDNPRNRALHHHVFTTQSALALLDHLGLELLAARVRYPHDIYTLARLPDPEAPKPENAAMLRQDTPFLRSSPFRGDRRLARSAKVARAARSQRAGGPLDVREQGHVPRPPQPLPPCGIGI
jgi:SAM-dependent methyltransferase